MEALRRNGIDSVLDGCIEGMCGACNVTNEDTGGVIRSCLFSSERFDGAAVTTAAGLVDDETSEFYPVQAAFLNRGAAQWVLHPGMMVAAKLLRDNGNPAREEVARALNGNICRCTGYVRQFDAVDRLLPVHKVPSRGNETEPSYRHGVVMEPDERTLNRRLRAFMAV